MRQIWKGTVRELRGKKIKWKLRYAWISNWEFFLSRSKAESWDISIVIINQLWMSQFCYENNGDSSTAASNLWHDCVTSVTLQLSAVPAKTTLWLFNLMFLHRKPLRLKSPSWNSSALGLLIEISPGDCLMESGSHPLSFRAQSPKIIVE